MLRDLAAGGSGKADEVPADCVLRSGHPEAPTHASGGRRLAVTDSGALLVDAFVWLTWLTHARFATFGFDLGIFDQGVWLLSRSRILCDHPRIAPNRSDRPPSAPRSASPGTRRRSRRAASTTRATSSATPRPNRKAYSGRRSNVSPPR